MELTSRGKRILFPVMAVAAINFTAAFVFSLLIGGDAPNGCIINERYYVQDHGKKTEVTKGIWIANYVHTLSGLAGIGIVFIVFFWLLLRGELYLKSRIEEDVDSR